MDMQTACQLTASITTAIIVRITADGQRQKSKLATGTRLSGGNTMKSESTIQSEIRIALSDYGIVFRTNAGDFWQGTVVFSKEFNQNVLTNMRRVQGLPEGFTDLLFVGTDIVGFIETKNTVRKPTPEQLNFIEAVQRLGHRAGIARSVEDALMIIKGNLSQGVTK